MEPETDLRQLLQGLRHDSIALAARPVTNDIGSGRVILCRPVKLKTNPQVTGIGRHREQVTDRSQ